MNPDQYSPAEAKATMLEFDLSVPMINEAYLLKEVMAFPQVLIYTGEVNARGQYLFRMTGVPDVKIKNGRVIVQGAPAGRTGLSPANWKKLYDADNVIYLGVVE